MQRFKWLPLGLVAAALLSLAVAGSALAAKPKPKRTLPSGGTVVFGAEQEPTILNPHLVGGDLFWTSQVASPVLPAAFRIQPDFSIQPDLASDGKVLKRNPFTVVIHIRKNANWMDGKPITGNDFLWGAQQQINPNVKAIITDGFDLIDFKASKVTGGGKTLTLVFTKPYEPWKLLFDTGSIWPSHVLQGVDFNKVGNTDYNDPSGKPMSGGPYYMPPGSWVRGQQLTLLKNPKYWGPKPHLARLVYRYLPDTNTTVQEIKGGTVDLIYPAPDVFLVPLRSDKAIGQQIGQGVIYEHIDFNQGYRGGNPLLKNLWMRQAIAYGIDRNGLVQALFRSTGIAPKMPVLNSVVIMANMQGYTQAWKQYTHQASKAENLLKSHGCTKGGDGIYSCGGQRASFRFGYRAGIALREKTFEIFQAQLKQIGIEITPYATPTFNSVRLVAGDYDIALFAWVGNPDIVSGTANIDQCRNDATGQGGQNYTAWCNQKATTLLEQMNRSFDYATQAKLMNQVNAEMAKDLNTIPLYQRPTALVYRKTIHGTKENPTTEGPVWNVNTWYKTST
jgi:peptide/nickel transport system substrate-binding protein